MKRERRKTVCGYLPGGCLITIMKTSNDAMKYGFFRPIIGEVVRNYLACGDCCEEYLLAFSCKGRWFCPSCHAKKVVQFGDVLNETILYPVPHRQYVFSIHNKALIAKDGKKGRVALAQYIIRNTFSLENLTYNQEAGTVIYRSKMTSGKNKKSCKSCLVFLLKNQCKSASDCNY
jgi:hypothetical protein